MSPKLLSNVLSIINEISEKEGVLYLTQDELKEYLRTVSYNMDILTRTKRFKDKKIVITGELDLRDTPIASLKPIIKVNGKLDISNTNVASIEGIEVTGYVSDFGSKMQKIRRARELAEVRAKADSRRESGEWEDTSDDYSAKAKALFQYLQGRDDIQDRPQNLEDRINELEEKKSELEQRQEQLDGESEEYTRLNGEIATLETEIEELNEGKFGDVYDLIPDGEMYGLSTFKSLLPDSEDEVYFIGDEDEVEQAFVEYWEQYVDDVGIEGFSRWLIEDNLDEDRLRSDIEDVYENDIRDNLESYLDDEDKELSGTQEAEIERLEKEKAELEEKLYVEDINPESPEHEKITDLISEMEDEIQEIKDNPDGEYNEEAIQDKIDSTVEYYMENKNEFLSNMGYSLDDYLDKDSLVKYLVNNEDYGQMSSYNEGYDNEDFNGNYYYIFRQN